MFYQVIVNYSNKPALRMVEVDDRIVDDVKSKSELLEWIFRNGQNDFQPRMCPSVSVGDLILLNDSVYVVEPFGFKKLNGIL